MATDFGTIRPVLSAGVFANDAATSGGTTRCGRFGPASDGDSARSSDNVSVNLGSAAFGHATCAFAGNKRNAVIIRPVGEGI